MLKGCDHSKRRTKIGFQDRLSLNAGQKYCRMLQGEHSAILSTFIKLPFVIKSFVLSIFEWRLATECGTSQSLVSGDDSNSFCNILPSWCSYGSRCMGQRYKKLCWIQDGCKLRLWTGGQLHGCTFLLAWNKNKIYSKGHLKLFVYRETPKTAL